MSDAAARNKQYRTKHRRRILARKREHYRENRERILAYDKMRREKNWKEISARGARYYKKNRSRILARTARYRKNNPDKIQAANREQYVKNRDERLAYTRRYLKQHPEKLSEYTHRRRTRIQYNGGDSWTASEWIDLKQKYDNRCVQCLKPEHVLCKLKRHLAPDHVVPLSHPSTLLKRRRGYITNIQPLCHGKDGCNNRKYTKLIDYRPTFQSRLNEATKACPDKIFCRPKVGKHKNLQDSSRSLHPAFSTV